jgi:two-component system cell cycle sensor histidine kinase/response regulator CckA
MNLVINGADSIGDGHGTVEVTTELQTIGEEHLEANLARTMPQRGEYVAITVEDTGCGTDEPTRKRILDPFLQQNFRAAVWVCLRFLESSADIEV